MKTGLELIAAERTRQIAGEGWTTAHDDEHDDESLAAAAACYALPAPETKRTTRKEMEDVALRGDGPLWETVRRSYRVPVIWPRSWHPSWWKPKDRIRNLVRAGALIAAEIDRLQRAEAKAKNEERTTR